MKLSLLESGGETHEAALVNDAPEVDDALEVASGYDHIV